MKNIIISSIVVLLLSTTLISAQWGRGNCRRVNNTGNATNVSRNYDVNTVRTVTGEVKAISYNQHGRVSGVHVAVVTEDGEIDAHFGPDYAYDEQKLNLKEGDKVTLKGSMVDYNDGKAMSVSVATVGDKEYVLRDDNGVPAWSGNGKAGRGARCRGWGNRRI